MYSGQLLAHRIGYWTISIGFSIITWSTFDIFFMRLDYMIPYVFNYSSGQFRVQFWIHVYPSAWLTPFYGIGLFRCVFLNNSSNIQNFALGSIAMNWVFPYFASPIIVCISCSGKFRLIWAHFLGILAISLLKMYIHDLCWCELGWT